MSVPPSTYRLQLNTSFDFAAATAQADYLAALGVGALYLSPILTAEPGSTHGYDCVDPSQINPELGGDVGFDALAEAAQQHQLGLVVDFVPNHMGIASHHNPLWYDVLENGKSSRFAESFDIDWRPAKLGLENRVLLPILGGPYGVVLESGELKVERERGTLRLRYYERILPLAPRPLAPILERAAARTGLDVEHPDHIELLSIETSLRKLPDREQSDEKSRTERAREKEVAKRRLAALTMENASIAQAIDAEVAHLNADPDALDALLSQQGYRLSNWRVALETINYRRFFDVNTLAAVRVEDPAVFEHFHARLAALVADGRVTGIRLDHTDGLFDPTAYFEALRAKVGDTPWIVAEKIIEPGETLPRSWRIDGTTGYEFAWAASQVLFDPRSEPALDAFYRRFTGDDVPFDERMVQSKRLIVQTSLASELQVLARMLERIAGADRRHRDLTLGAMITALTELIAAFPVYRTYLRPDGSRQPHDDSHLAWAMAQARRRNPGLSPDVFQFLAEVVSLRGETLDPERVAFVMKLQQMTGPAMAKSVEDTAFYVHARFLAANEVGGDPGHIGLGVTQFHEQNELRQRHWPKSMITTSTHDTKRGEDARARLAVITEMPVGWRHSVSRWSRVARARKEEIDGEPAPSRSDEYVFYQALLGAMPFDFDRSEQAIAGLESRLSEYLLKAAREAKTHTSWVNQNEPYEKAITTFVGKMLHEPLFLDDFADFSERIGPAGATNALAQCALKLCSPGVPDTDQGSELWEQSLVDPDNRRPVDYARRREMLDRAKSRRDLLEHYQDGGIKLWVTHKLLTLRREHAALFAEGDYRGLEAGPHVIAFARSHEGRTVVCVVPRLPMGLAGGAFPIGPVWGDAQLEGVHGRYTDVLSGVEHTATGKLRLADLMQTLPLAVLVSS